MKEKIMPPLVLMLISAIVCALLVAANAATKDKIVQAQEDKIQQNPFQNHVRQGGLHDC